MGGREARDRRARGKVLESVRDHAMEHGSFLR